MINGISLSNSIFSPNEDIVLYNPKNKNLYPNCSGYDRFTNGDSIIDYNKNVNVSIKVKAICAAAVPDIAKNKLDNYLNIIKVLTPTNNFSMDNKQTIILDSKKNVCTLSHSAYSDENEKRDFESLKRYNGCF